MKIESASLLAHELMFKHELIQKGWIFSFDRSVKRFGCCKCGKKQITLSKKLTELNDNKHVKDTILHEIAHAIDFERRGVTDHSFTWRNVCMEVGANPERYYSEEVIEPEPKYYLWCKNCGNKSGRTRKPKYMPSCGKCDKKYNTKYLLTVIKNR